MSACVHAQTHTCVLHNKFLVNFLMSKKEKKTGSEKEIKYQLINKSPSVCVCVCTVCAHTCMHVHVCVCKHMHV